MHARALAAVTVAMLGSVHLGGLHPAHAQSYPPLFGTREIRSENLKSFPKWTGVLERMIDSEASKTAACAKSAPGQCHLNDWKAILEAEAGRDRETQIRNINRIVNERVYITDPVNWGVIDYWATPREFRLREGDCEDYAIAKFALLRALGFRNEDLRIAIVQDLNLRIPHAILVVYHAGRALILDNQARQVIAADKIRHYRPIYSINERTWWLHR